MIIVVIIISIIYIILLALILKAYYKNISDLENRILHLEKRIEEIKHYTYQEYKTMRNTLENEFCYYDQQLERLIKDKKNNTQEGSESDMPCGRKKGRGGRKK